KPWLVEYAGVGTYLTLWLLYGFSISQIMTLLMRHGVVTLVLSVVLSSIAAFLWLPSLVTGGLAAWQVFVVPVVVLLTSRLVMWPWVSGRLFSFRSVALLAGSGSFALLWIVGCLTYRVWDAPAVGEPFDVKAFLASMPTAEKNEAGRLIPRSW